MLNHLTPNLGRIAASAVVLAAMAGPAFAQGRNASGRDLGESSIGASGVPSVANVPDGLIGFGELAIRYDPQAARADGAIAARRGLEQKELNYRLTGDVAAGRSIGNVQAGVRGNVDYELHEKNQQLDTRSHELNTILGARFGVCGGSTTGSIRRRQSLLEQSDLTYLRNTEQNLQINASVGCGLPSGLQGGIQANYVELTNSAGRSRDSEARAVSAYFGYGDANLGSINLTVSYSDNSFEQGVLVPGTVAPPEQESVLYGIRYTRPLIRNLTGSVEVGYVITEFDGGLVDDSSSASLQAQLRYELPNVFVELIYDNGAGGLRATDALAGRTPTVGSAVEFGPGGGNASNTTSYRGRVEYQVGPRITLGAEAGRDTRVSELAGAAYTRGQFGNIRANFQAGSSLYLNTSLDYRRSNFDGQVTLPGGLLSDTMRLARSENVSFNAGATYSFGERIFTSLNYTQFRNKTNSQIPLELSVLPQLRSDRSKRIAGRVGVELPLRARVAFDLSYERRRASVEEFSYNAVRAGMVLSIRY